LTALLAQIAVSKYTDGLPLYRQEAIYARDKVELDRKLMAQWMGKLGFELDILADYILAEIKKAERIFADETTLPTLAPGSESARTAWLWAYARDDSRFGGSSPSMVAYRFEDSREKPDPDARSVPTWPAAQEGTRCHDDARL
jgi:transposase